MQHKFSHMVITFNHMEYIMVPSVQEHPRN